MYLVNILSFCCCCWQVIIKHTTSGNTVIVDRYTVKHTSSGNTVLFDRYTAKCTSSGNAVLFDRYTAERTSSGDTVLFDSFTAERTSSGNTVLFDRYTAKRTSSGNTVLFDRYTAKRTSSGNTVYAIILKWPTSPVLSLGAPKPSSRTKVTLLGYKGAPFTYMGPSGGGIVINIPKIPFNQMPGDWGWVLKLEALTNQKTGPLSADRLLHLVKSLN